MKFVVRVSWSVIVPIEYDSVEALYVDLNKAILDGMEALRTYCKNGGGNPPCSVVFAGKIFQLIWFDPDDSEPIQEGDIMLLGRLV